MISHAANKLKQSQMKRGVQVRTRLAPRLGATDKDTKGMMPRISEVQL